MHAGPTRLLAAQRRPRDETWHDRPVPRDRRARCRVRCLTRSRTHHSPRCRRRSHRPQRRGSPERRHRWRYPTRPSRRSWPASGTAAWVAGSRLRPRCSRGRPRAGDPSFHFSVNCAASLRAGMLVRDSANSAICGGCETKSMNAFGAFRLGRTCSRWTTAMSPRRSSGPVPKSGAGQEEDVVSEGARSPWRPPSRRSTASRSGRR